MTISQCPSYEHLQQLNNGSLQEDAANQIVTHLDVCPKCHETIATLSLAELTLSDSSPTLPGSLQYADEPEYQRVEAILRNMQTADDRTHIRDTDRLPVGTSIGPYQIEGWIGEGGMGTVYRSLHSKLKKIVALKLLPVSQRFNSEIAQRFEREMETVGAFDHPNIVRGMDAGSADGYLYLAMEFVNGQTLTQLLQAQGRLSTANACEIIRQAAEGLSDVHAKGIVHRDVKPSNLMLSRDESGVPVVKILDLGLARIEQDEAVVAAVTQTGQILGTLEYLAPEQADDSRNVDHLVDIYSLGATLYKLLSGEAPVSLNRYRTPIRMLSAIANVTPESLAEKTVVPEDLSQLVDQMLSRDPAKRPATARQIADALLPFAYESDLGELLQDSRHMSFPADTLAPMKRTEQRIRPSSSLETPVRATKPSQKNNARWWVLLIAPLLLLLFAATIWLKTDGGYLRIVADPAIAVTVDILNDGEVVNSVEISRLKDAVWYRSGEYEIRLPADQRSKFSLRNGKFVLKNRRREVVTIEKIPDRDIPKVTDPPPVEASPNLPVDNHTTEARDHQSQGKPEQVTISPIENADLKFLRWFWNNCKGNIVVELPEGRVDVHHVTNRAVPKFEIQRSPAVAQASQPRRLKIIGLTLSRNRQVTNEFVYDIPFDDLEHLEHIYFDNQRSLTPAVYEYLLREKPDLKGLSDIPILTDELISVVQKFPSLERISIHGQSGDEWAAALKTSQTLKTVSCYRTQLSETGIKDLSNLPNLKEFILDGEPYRSSWLNPISSMKQLTHLTLPERRDQTVTETELKKLAKLKNLTRLVLGAEASIESVLSFRRELPNCKVSFFNQGLPKTFPLDILYSRFGESQAKTYQSDWAKSLGLPIEKEVVLPGGAAISFQFIPPGEFYMGSTEQEIDQYRAQSESYDDGWGLSQLPTEGPRHRVRISKPFYLSQFEMTRAQWASITGSDPTNRSYHKGDPSLMPVVEISWNDIQEMLANLNHHSEHAFFLPTEAQWEYACRAGTTTPFFFGPLETALHDHFWYFGNAERKEKPVGSLKPNSWGIYDMHGNVHEWVHNRATVSYPDKALSVDPQGPQENVHRDDLRIFRGGSVWDPPTACRSALRGRRPPDYSFHALGLRLVMDIPTPE